MIIGYISYAKKSQLLTRYAQTHQILFKTRIKVVHKNASQCCN